MTTQSGGRSKKHSPAPSQAAMGDCARASAAFVANMEDVLEVHQRPHDPKHPLLCRDETSKQLIAETGAPIAATPGQAQRYDYDTSAVALPICS